MKVDNFNLIKSLLKFDSNDEFYLIQVLKRRKENPEMKKDVKYIDDFFVYNSDMEDWDLTKEYIVKKCEDNNARAYIRLNRRNNKTIALQTMRKLAEKIANEDYTNFQSAYISACGKYSSEPEKKWIIDLDGENTKWEESIIHFVDGLKPQGFKYKATIPTVNGVHIISRPFDLKTFAKSFPKIDVHKDNPTVLYY